MEAENAKVLSAKGELSDENTASYEKLRKSFDQLLRGVSSVAEAIDLQPPVMPDDGNTTRVTTGTDVTPSSGKEPSVLEPIWDDDDTKTFYESLPDLRAFVPAVLLGEAEQKLNEQHAKGREQSSESNAEQETEVHDNAQTSSATEDQLEGKADDVAKDSEEKEKDKGKEAEKSKEKDLDRKTEKDKEKVRALDGGSLDNLLQRLPGCVSRDLIDQLTVEFCYLNSKASRKKLVRALFSVPRTSLELLPYYSRMIATLSSCMKDVPTMLLPMLEEEFNFLINKKDQINIETKIKNIRFIGELCKFKIAPAALVFSCLKACLDDFNHHNIDVACNLLETCGRFLYRSPETTIRMANMLEILMRLKNVKNLDPRHSTLVENAYYLCKPPERSARVSKVRPPLYQYIRKLLFSDLDKSSVEHVLRQLRKLPWVECQQYLVKCFLKVHKGKYSQVHLIALLTAGLSRYHDDFAVAVVDEQDVLDPPEDCFRIRLIITLLQTCGHYFTRGSSKRKLDKFLLHFQRYIIMKGPLPLDIEFDIQDLFAELRPNMTRYSSIDELNSALAELEEHERAASVEKPESERHSDNESQKRQPHDDGRGSANGAEGNGKDHGEGADSESYSDSGSIGGHEDEEDLLSEEKSNDASENEGDDEDDGMPVGSDEDEGVEVRQKVVQVDPKEQEDFDRELKALLQESLESRKSEVRSRSSLNMKVPMNVLEGSKDARAVESESGEETVDEEGGNAGGGSKVRVKVLMKKGHKQQTKQMFVPGDCSLVQSTKQQEAAELEEKQNIKRRILEYNEREEEEMNGGSSQMGNWGQGGSNTSSSIRSGGRGNWDGWIRGGARRHHAAGGFYQGYGRRR
uniref:MIF4G domain-containing protein n=1 Tax=Triticum aestivum TaxID=4565 RepID=A0A3B6NRX4_WHEAT